MNIQQEIEDMKEALKSLEQKAREQEPQGVWQPKEGEDYFGIEDTSEVYEDYYSEGCITTKARINQGNVFKTGEEAELEAKRREVTQKLRVLAGGFNPDWKDSAQTKVSVEYNSEHGCLGVESYRHLQTQGAIYFKTKEAAQHAVDTLGYELLVLFDVEV